MRSENEIQAKIKECDDLLSDIEVLIDCCATGKDCRLISYYKFKMTNVNIAHECDIDVWYQKEKVIEEAKKALKWVLNLD